jgi:hypothetical protein
MAPATGVSTDWVRDMGFHDHSTVQVHVRLLFVNAERKSHLTFWLSHHHHPVYTSPSVLTDR